MHRTSLDRSRASRRPLGVEPLERRVLLTWGDWPLHVNQDLAVSKFPGLVGSSTTTIVDGRDASSVRLQRRRTWRCV